MRTASLFLLSCAASSALVLPGGALRSSTTPTRFSPINLQEADPPSGDGKYAEAEERGRAALDKLQEETAAAEAMQAAKDALAEDAEGAPFDPLFGGLALLLGAVLGYLVNMPS